MPQDALQVMVGTGGQCYIGIDTAAAITDSDTAPGTGWADIGYVSEDGCTLRYGASTEGVPVWQSSVPVRTIKQETEAQVEFALMQWFGDSLIVAFGGGKLTGTAGENVYEAPAGGDPLRIFRVCMAWTDKGYDYRLYVPRAQLADVTEAQVLRTEAADIPIVMDMLDAGANLGPFKIFTEDPAFTPAASLLDLVP